MGHIYILYERNKKNHKHFPWYKTKSGPSHAKHNIKHTKNTATHK
jgi:hypothetical protein